MDPNEFKNNAELKQRHDQSKAAFAKHKADHQQSEILKIKNFFKSFFGDQEGYHVGEHNGQVIATVANQNITLTEDEFQSRRDPTHSVHLKVRFPDGEEKQIGTQTSHDYVGSNTKPGQKISEEEQLQRDIDFYNSIVNGNANILTSYYLKLGQKKRILYKSLEELFKAM